MSYIHGAAIVLVWLAACVYAIAPHDAVVRVWVRWVLLTALVCGVLPFLWGCASPTAPTQTAYLWQIAATGCQPMPGYPVVDGLPDVEVTGNTIQALVPQANGRRVVLVAWTGQVNALFIWDAGVYALCQWWR